MAVSALVDAVDLLAGLALETPRLLLRLPDAVEIDELASLAEAGIHPPDHMPFATPWTDAAGTPAFRAEAVAHHAAARASWTPDDWVLLLAVFVDGSPIGIQDLRGKVADGTLTVETGSWLGERFQGRGYGTEMRAAVLELAFTALGAVSATSGWIDGSVASRRVSDKLGYEEVERREVRPRGDPVTEHVVRIDRERWRSPVPVTISGLAGCRHLFRPTAA